MNVHVHKLCRFYPPEFWAHAATAHPTDVRRKIFTVCSINRIKYGVLQSIKNIRHGRKVPTKTLM